MFDLKMNLAYESALLRAKEEGHAKIYIEHILFELLGDAEFCDKLDAFDIEGNILARRNLLRLFMVLPRAQEGEPPRPSELTSELLERAQERLGFWAGLTFRVCVAKCANAEFLRDFWCKQL